MCYKQDNRKRIAIRFEEQTKNYPYFFKDYFLEFKGWKTKVTNLSYIKLLFDWLLQNNVTNKKIENLTASDIQHIKTGDIMRYLTSLNDGIDCCVNSISTIQTKIAVFNSLWNYWVKIGLVENNIMAGINRKKFKKETKQGETTIKIKLPTEDQVLAFYHSVDGDTNNFRAVRNHAIIKLFVGSGIRKEELIGLDLSDVHLDGELPYIEVMGKGNIMIKDDVYISQEACMYLKEYIEYRQYVKNVIDKEALFISERKKARLTSSGLDYMFQRHSKGQITPHMLRHYCGTKLYEAGVPIEDVSEQLRHKHINTTNQSYVHKNKSRLSAAISNL